MTVSSQKIRQLTKEKRNPHLRNQVLLPSLVTTGWYTEVRLANSLIFNDFLRRKKMQQRKEENISAAPFGLRLLSSSASSPPPYRWSQAAFNNPMHSHASTPQATPLMLHYSHTERQCQFPRQDPCLCSPDWITLVQHGAVTLGLRALHGPAGSHVGLK